MVKEISAPNHIIALELDGKLAPEDIQSDQDRVGT